MLALIAHNLVLLTGALILVLGFAGFVRPRALVGLVQRFSKRSFARPFAVIVRLVAGAAILYVSSRSKYPVAFAVVGSITVIAGIALAFMGQRRFEKLVDWVAAWPAENSRIALFAAAILGGFLIYGLW
jgi:hypothetical protein